MTWRDSAACADADPNLFDPESRNRNVEPFTEARAICGGCPVQAECLEDALRHEQWVMRGGLTPDELNSLRRKRQRARAKAAAVTDANAPECVGGCGKRVLPRQRQRRAPEGYAWHQAHGLCGTCYQRSLRPEPTRHRGPVDEAAVAASSPPTASPCGTTCAAARAVVARHATGPDDERELLAALGLEGE